MQLLQQWVKVMLMDTELVSRSAAWLTARVPTWIEVQQMLLKFFKQVNLGLARHYDAHLISHAKQAMEKDHAKNPDMQERAHGRTTDETAWSERR